jgi:hypothetical protein
MRRRTFIAGLGAAAWPLAIPIVFGTRSGLVWSRASRVQEVMRRG